MAHFLFFHFIDGRGISNAFALRQSHVATFSLLLITAFRAVIVAALGICFTQYLWYTVRTRCLKISLIEDLFQIRSNVFELANLKNFRQAPVLFLAATLSWLVPLATIYPPGALTVQSELYTSLTNVNASIMNPKLDFAVNQVDIRSLADISGGVHYRDSSGSSRGYVTYMYR